MRFGIFIFAVSLEPERDSEVIAKTLRQVDLAEELGFDAVFLAEHHFDGSSAYVDPLVFGAAIAQRTERIEIGFAVLQLALHNPVRLAEQTALLDQLSHGRLVVGTGRGSVHNIFEYVGYGVSIEDGRAMLAESEELLVKAWTEKDVKHDGRFWKAEFDQLRPRPYRKPHPELVRAAMSDASIAEMARLGRPILMGAAPLRVTQDRFELYRSEMRDAGFNDDEVEERLSRSWAVRAACLAPTDKEAITTGTAGHHREYEHARRAREKHSPPGSAMPGEQPAGFVAPPPVKDDLRDTLLTGSPATFRDRIAEIRAAGVPNVMFQMDIGQMDEEVVTRSMVLFAKEVMPEFV